MNFLGCVFVRERLQLESYINKFLDFRKNFMILIKNHSQCHVFIKKYFCGQRNCCLRSGLTGARSLGLVPFALPLSYHIFPFKWVENYLFTFGMDGKGCLLRAICETHETPLLGYGLIGEFLEVFLS